MKNKKFELLGLKEIFLDGERAFVIPEYQRGYSWEKRQRADLLKDIEYLIESDYTHYTGTLVIMDSDQMEKNTTIFDIVDGQQRLTSLVILLTSLLHQKQLCDKNKVELQNVFIASGTGNGNTIRKFSLNTLLDDYFYKFIIQENQYTETILTKSHRNISDAFSEFSQWLISTQVDHDTLYKIITERLGFLLYAPKDSTEIGIMFEVINNRGKPLSELEKIKNYLIYFSEKNNIKDLRTVVNNSWGNILKNLNIAELTSNDDENSFLRNCWIVFEDTNKSRSYYVYDTLKERFPATKKDKWIKLKEFVSFLEKASKTYRYLMSSHEITEISIEEQKWLNYISLHASNASILPLVIAIYERVVNDTERTELVELLEKLNFRYYGCGIANRNDSGQGELFLLAHRFYNQYGRNIEINGEVHVVNFNWLEGELRDFIDKHANDDYFIQYLTLDKDEDYDYYNWNNLRFFLANYEENLRIKKNRSTDLGKMLAAQNKNARNDYYQKEHIWARKERTIIDDFENINKRRLGNFVLLEPSINISVSNNTVEKKVDNYFKITKNDVPNTYMLAELNTFYTNAKENLNKDRQRKTKKYWYALNQNFLDYREEKLINFALNRWKVNDLKTFIDKVSINSNTNSNKCYTYEVQKSNKKDSTTNGEQL